MKTLIIGHRGFVGQNLRRYFPDAICAGRVEISSLAGDNFSDIYCAAPQAKKWWANQNPNEDMLEVQLLIKACSKLSCDGTFTLFSTIDVYDPPVAVDELCKLSVETHPYGLHRILLEQAVLDLFGSKVRIIRLPALVGFGLKKNIIYDLLAKKNVEMINPNSVFQWFNLDQLPCVFDLLNRLGDNQILNVVSEPLPTSLILDTWFADLKELLNWHADPIVYDVRTVHGSNRSHYLFSAEDVMFRHLQPFIEAPCAQP